MPEVTDKAKTRLEDHGRLTGEASIRRAPIALSLELAIWLVLAAPVVLLVIVPRPSGLLWDNLFNAAHVCASFVVALACLRLSRRLLGSRIARPWLHYLISLTMVAIVGGALEALQFVLPGTPSAADLVRDFLGGAAGVLFALSRDTQTMPRASRSRSWRWGLVGAATLSFGSSLLPMLVTAGAALHRRQAFPVLARFDSPWDAHFVSAGNGASLELTPPPTGFGRRDIKKAAKVVFASNHTYPKLEITSPLGDWSTYQFLAFDVYSPSEEPVRLVLRVHDRTHRHEEQDRFNTRLIIQPGNNAISIPLQAISAGPLTRRMDMSAIVSIAVFMYQPSQPATLYFDDFRVVR